MLLIQNAHILPIVGEEIENGSLLIDQGKIAAIGTDLPVPPGAEVIDACGRLVTPGCIDAHCHIGLDNEGMGWEGMDYNEITDPCTPQLRGIDSINPIDEAFLNAVKGGVTTAVTGPGSANVVGGTFAAIKLYGKRVDKMILKHPVAMKVAFGENPKRCYSNMKKSPYTRMGTAALLREILFKTQRYMQDKEEAEKNGTKLPPFDMKLEAMIPVLKREIPLKAHAHRSDDICTAIRIAKEFGVKMTLEHVTEGHLIVEELKRAGFPCAVGPTLTNASKIELVNKTFETPGILAKAGLQVSIITDAPVIPQQYLPLCAGLAVKAGMDPFDALKAITINPAKHLGVDKRVGSLESGKDGDVVVCDGDPMVSDSCVKAVFINGERAV